jgi:hypothetical protein
MHRPNDMMIAIMCDPSTWHPAGRESQRVCGHTLNDVGVHHLSANRQVALCGIDCSEFVFIVKVESEKFVTDKGICSKCVEKLP